MVCGKTAEHREPKSRFGNHPAAKNATTKDHLLESIRETTKDLTDFEAVRTPLLRAVITQARKTTGDMVAELRELEKRARALRADLTVWRGVLRAHEEELRDREPEPGGIYVHPEGFEYRSFRGRERWQYRITGTPVTVYEGPNDNGYVFYSAVCDDHGIVPLSDTNPMTALSRGFAHAQKEHS